MYYQTLAPARYQVRDGIRGGWYVIDTDPGTYSSVEGVRPPVYFKDSYRNIYKNARRDYFRTYNGARNLAARLNGK